MSTPEELREYEVEIYATVTASSVDEAYAALARSGLTSDALIGETMIASTEVVSDE